MAPNPAVLGLPVTITAAVGGGPVTPTGTVDVFIAGSGLRCPAPFAAGNPGDPVAPARTATLDAAGRAQVVAGALAIGDYFVCVRYNGDGLYSGATAGPVRTRRDQGRDPRAAQRRCRR